MSLRGLSAFLLQIRFWILQLSLPFPVLVPLGEHTARGGGEEERERDTFCLFFSSLLPIPMRKEGEREREGERGTLNEVAYPAVRTCLSRPVFLIRERSE